MICSMLIKQDDLFNDNQPGWSQNGQVGGVAFKEKAGSQVQLPAALQQKTDLIQTTGIL